MHVHFQNFNSAYLLTHIYIYMNSLGMFAGLGLSWRWKASWPSSAYGQHHIPDCTSQDLSLIFNLIMILIKSNSVYIYIEFGQNQNIFLMKQSLPPKKNIVNNHVAWKNSSCGLEKFFVNWATQSHSLQESQNPGAETDHCQSPGAGSQLWCSVQTYVGVHRHHWHACGWFGGLLVCS